MAENYVTQAEFAKILGVKTPYITTLKQKGMLVVTVDGVDVEKSLKLLEDVSDPAYADMRTRQTQRPNDTVSGQLDDISSKAAVTFQKARALDQHYRALKSQLEYEQAIGQLVNANDVRYAVMNAGMVLRTRLEAMPDTLDPQLEAETDPTRRRIVFMDFVESLLGDISQAFHELTDKREAA